MTNTSHKAKRFFHFSQCCRAEVTNFLRQGSVQQRNVAVAEERR
jgi:hypothetical protein